jgi:hypothetical protein
MKTVDSKHGRRPKQYSDNNGTPSLEGTNLGDMALGEAVSARSIASGVSPIDSDESSTSGTETESSHTE